MQKYSDNGIHAPYRENYYYREDVTLPPYDRSGVDMLGFKKEGFFTSYIYIQNKELVDQIFALKDKAQDKSHGGGGAFDFVY